MAPSAGAITSYDWDLEPGVLVLGILVLLAFYLTSALGYGAIVDRLHHPGPRPLVTLSIWARSLLGRYVPGNVLMVLGRVVLSHEQGVPRPAHGTWKSWLDRRLVP